MNTQTECVSSAMLEPLLSIAQRDPEGAVRLAALDAASRLPLSQDGWRAFWTVLQREIEASRQDPEARARALALAVRIPLLSVRRELRRIAAAADDSAAAILADALAAAGDPSQIERLLTAADAGQWEALVWLAAMPLEAQGVAISSIPVPTEDADPEVRLWYALAVARLGEFAALDAFLEGREQEPGMFWGSPGVPYARIAAMRPVPGAMDEHLRAALPAVERLEEQLAAKTARIIIWAATGMANAEGSPIAAAAPVPAAAVATKMQVNAAKAAARDLLQNPAGGAGSDDLAFLPQSEVAGFLSKLFDRANAMVKELPPEAIGNRMIDLVSLLPRATDWPVAALVVLQLESAPPALDDNQLAWVISRGPPERLIRELASLIVPERPTAQRLRILDIGASVADRLAGRGDGPYRGAAPGAAGAAIGHGPLIDDEELVLMAERKDGAEQGGYGEAGAAAEDDELGIGPAMPASQQQQQQQQQGSREPRWILARAFDLSTKRPKHPTPAFRAGAKHEVQVIIGADQPDWLVARGRDPSQSIDSMLPTGSHVLTVVFFRPDSGVQTRKLTLPPDGPTPKPAKFRFDVGPAGTRIEALISIVYRGCVLQTAMLSGLAVDDPANVPEEARIALRLQVVVPGFAELDRRQGFDAALVTGRAASSNAVVAGVVHSAPDTGRTLCFRQPRIEKAAQSIRALIEDVVTDDSLKRGLDTKAAEGLLWKLAQHGRILYECIGRRLENELSGRDLSRLQLVQTDPGAFIPIEFVYELPAPANGARLCRNWRAALTGRPCTAKHHELDALGHLRVVCPSGFWSVSKVIERQILEDLSAEEIGRSDFGVRAEPSAARPRLPPLRSALFAWSEILDNTVPGTSAAVLASLNQATGKHAASVSTWLEGAEAVDQQPPALLVLLSHTFDEALESGPEDSGERATVAQINTRYVKKLANDAPIVFLLGCDTAVADDKLVSFVGKFRDQGAALVVGTITPVLGERSAAVVRTVVEKLAQKRRDPVSFGELMRDARCELLSKGELTALCATSFGDAGWLVG